MLAARNAETKMQVEGRMKMDMEGAMAKMKTSLNIQNREKEKQNLESLHYKLGLG